MDMVNHLKFYDNGIELDDIYDRFGCKPHDIMDIVVVSPMWKPSQFMSLKNRIVSSYNDQIFTIQGKRNFTFLATQMGSLGLGDLLIPLVYTNRCKYLFFIGTAGSLSESISIGDLIVADHAKSQASYDEFIRGNAVINADQVISPRNTELAKSIYRYLSCGNGVNVHNECELFCTPSLLGQFMYLSSIQKHYSAIEMETSTFFTISEMCDIDAAALLIVSDNIIIKKNIFRRLRGSDLIEFTKAKTLIPSVIDDVLLNI